MLVDFGSATKLLSRCNDLDLRRDRVFEKTLVSADFWEEHCIECGAPLCYKTCDKFIKAADGRCARIVNGILPVVDGKKNRAVAVQFAPWGKLELCYRGNMIADKQQAKIDKIDRVFMSVAILLNRMFTFVPYKYNPTGLWRGLRKRFVTKKDCNGVSPTHWVIQCFALESTELVASILNNANDEVFADRINLRKGKNNIVLSIPVVKATSFFKLFSIDGTSKPIYFTDIQLCCGRELPTQNAEPAQYVKCLIWDLDNTLWDGILVEDGPDGVVLRHKAVEVIKALDSRGILNSICSKNDLDPVRAQLKKYELLEYFVFPEVNWMPKSENIDKIRKNINIGINTFAFVDDSPSERGEVSERYPMIRVYNEKELDKILKEECFNPPISKESSSRRLSYLAEMERCKDEQFLGGSKVDFLRKCQIRLVCEDVKQSDVVQRCWELVNRTNQLTLAAHRYSEAEFNELILKNKSYCIRCEDKYGDYGIIGFIAIRVESNVARVVEFVMSCRVAKKLCEQSVLMFFAEDAKNRGCTSMCATAISTGRNAALIEAFDAMPFKKALDTDGKEINYELSLRDAKDWDSLYRNEVKFGEAS